MLVRMKSNSDITLTDVVPFSCSGFIGLAIRVAQILGLHRDPAYFEDINPITAEVRRRVWWHIFYIDVLIAIAAGLPPIIDRTSWDVQKLSEVRDELLGTPQALLYQASRQQVNEVADDPLAPIKVQMVSASGILVAGKLHAAGENNKFRTMNIG